MSIEKPRTRLEVERIQTGVRIEKQLLKVLKGLAELKDITLGDLLEGTVLYSFEGKAPFFKEGMRQSGAECAREGDGGGGGEVGAVLGEGRERVSEPVEKVGQFRKIQTKNHTRTRAAQHFFFPLVPHLTKV